MAIDDAWQQHIDELRRKGIFAQASLRGLQIWMSKTIFFGELIADMMLGGVAPLVFIYIVAAIFGPSPQISAAFNLLLIVFLLLIGLSLGAIPLYALMDLSWRAIHRYKVRSALIQRWLEDELILTPRSLRVRDRVFPLEDITELTVTRWGSLIWWLHARLRDGSRHRLACNGRSYVLESLREIIDQQRYLRIGALYSEGLDPEQVVLPPKELLALRSPP